MRTRLLKMAVVGTVVAVTCSVAGVSRAEASTGQVVTNLASGATQDGLVKALIGDGTPYSNVVVRGSDQSMGTYSGMQVLDASSAAGVVLDTGIASSTSASAVPGPNTDEGTSTVFSSTAQTDSDLAKLVPNANLFDITSLEFDFVPQSSTLKFSYVFASEEYSEWVNSSFNDVFGLFVNGQNCATINGQPVSVNTINNGKNNTGQNASNPSYFRANSVYPAGGGSPLDTGFDGLTTMLTCSVNVNQGQTNHVKFAIADVGDARLDSGVFIVGGSFVTTIKPQDDTATTNANQAVTVPVLANDPGTGLQVSSVTQPSHGTAAIQGSQVVYTPTGGYSGTDSFTYTVTAPNATPATANVTITVKPVAVNDTTTVGQNPATVDVLANDIGSNLSLGSVSQPAHGTAAISNGKVTYTPTPGYSGSDSFTYTVSDGTSTATATVTITVMAPPVANPDSLTTGQGKSAPVSVLANDTGQGISLTRIASQPAHGTAAVNNDGTVTYAPAAGYSGPDSFTYQITDNMGSTATGTVTVTVVAAPVANPDTATTGQGKGTTVDVLSNDSGTGISLTSVADPPHGTAAISDGKVTYTPDPGFSGTDTFTYVITDNQGNTATGEVTVTVVAAPVANPDQAKIGQGQSTAPLDVLGNDSGTGISLTSVADPPHGTASISDGKVTYTPAAGFSGTDSFTYLITDNQGNTATGTVTVTVVAAPVAAPDAATIGQGKTATVPVLANDSGEHITFTTVTSQPAHGSVTANTNTGVVTYTPAADFSGTDQFTYQITDDMGNVATAGVTVTVVAAPVANPDTATIGQGQTATIGVLDNDTGHNLTLVSTSLAPHGQVSVNGSSVTYTPVAGYSGTDSFTYLVADDLGNSATGTVTVVTTPSAVNDSQTVGQNPATVDVLANDVGTGLSLSSVTQPAHGTASISNGKVTYTTTPGYSGADSFAYTVSDGTSTATATVNITVIAGPVALPDSITTGQGKSAPVNVLSNDSGENITFSGITVQPAHGTTTVSNGTVTYTPAAGYSGPDEFTYQITDDQGSTATAKVTVNVVAAPVANPDQAKIGQGQSTSPLDVLNNDTGENITLTSVNDPSHGTVAVSDGKVTYTPAAGFSGTDTFTYVITDDQGNTATGTVTVTVVAAPVANPDTVTIGEGQSTDPLDVLNNDTGESITLTSVADPSHGTVAVSDGKVTYTPAAGFSGTDSFTYVITDDQHNTATGTVTVTVVAAPVANPDQAKIGQGQSTSPLDVLNNDTGENITLTSVNDPSHGTVAVSDGKVTYTPAADFSGDDSFTYVITDDQHNTATGTVTVTVVAAPVANPDQATIGEGQSTDPLDVLNNDSGESITLTSVSDPAHGTVAVSDGKVTYIPAAGFSGTDSFTYIITDDQGNTATGTVTVTVVAAPVANPDQAKIGQGQSTDPLDVMGNDTGENITLTSVSDPSHGTVAVSDGKVTYTPAAGFSGSDSFTYVITDDQGNTATGTVTVTVVAAPVANPDQATIGEGQSTDPLNIVSNDSGENITLTSVSDPPHGTVTIAVNTPGGGSPTAVTYTPDAGYSGPDTFTYVITDDQGNTSTGTVTVDVIAAPVANPDQAKIGEGQTSDPIDVLHNDKGDQITLTDVSDPGHGTVTVDNGTITYTPDKDFSGDDSFTYVITDSQGNTSTGTVTVTVVAAPVAIPDTASTDQGVATDPIDVLANDKGENVTILSTTLPSHGTIAIDNGKITYTPAATFSGEDKFDYTIVDDMGNTATTSVTITVAATIIVMTGGTAVSHPDILTSAADFFASTVHVVSAAIRELAHH